MKRKCLYYVCDDDDEDDGDNNDDDGKNGLFSKTERERERVACVKRQSVWLNMRVGQT